MRAPTRTRSSVDPAAIFHSFSLIAFTYDTAVVLALKHGSSSCICPQISLYEGAYRCRTAKTCVQNADSNKLIVH